MKHIKKLLASMLAAALVLPTAVLPVFADGVRERPSISVGTADPDYIGGIGEIDWGDTDWGAFGDVDFDGAADKTADELAALFDGTDVNVITTDSILSFESDEGAFYTDEGSDVDLDDLEFEKGSITFPAGDTVIISSAKETFNLIGETTLNIPDGSSVMVISAYKTETEEEDSYPTVIRSDTTLNINTNETGNLAVAAFNSGTISSWGIYAGNLNVYGTGVVASYGGKAQAQSTGVDADYSISVKGASLVGVGAPGDGGSVGVMVEDIKKEDGTFGTGTVSATDDAVIIGAGGIGTDYTYGIYTSSIEARNNSFIYACGAKVDGTDGDFSSIGLITAIADERTRTITSDNGSGIYASGKGEGSVGIGEFYFSEAENQDAEFGGVRIVIDDSENESSKSRIVAYGDMAAYKQSSDSSVNESKFKAPTGSVNVLGVDDTEDGSMNLVEFDTEKHTYTYNNNNATYIYVTKGETADYSLYYNPADSSFYKSYDETNGYSDKVENVAGATGDGKNLTLTSDFEFYTSADLGLVLPERTDININEGEHPIIVAGSFTDNNFTAGIYSMKGFALSINGGSRVGALHVSGGYGNNKDSFGIYSDGIVNISGKGMLECVGGCVNVESGIYDSVGIYARRNVLIFDTRVYADGGRVYADNEEAYGESVGMLTGVFNAGEENDAVSDGIGTYGDAYVWASAAGGSGNAASFGCITSYLLASDKSRLMLNTYGESMYTVGLGIQLNGNSGIDIFENASVSGKASGGDISYGLSEVLLDSEEFDGTKRIAVNIYNDGSMKFEGDTLAIAATRRMFGSISVKDGEDNPLTYDGERYMGYVNSEGKPAQKAVIKGLPDADYAIYYSPETGFRKNNKDGDLLTADELPEGMSAEGNTITLNDVEFHTTKKIALIADGGVTLNVPKNSRATLSVFNSDPVDPADPEASNVFGVMLDGDSVIQADGTMAVAANGEGRAFGLASYGNLTVKGEGELIAAEFFGADNSWALMSTENITIEDSAHVYAYANAIAGETEPNVSSSMSRQLTVKDNAVLDTSGGYNSRSIGIWDGYDLVTEDNASVIADGSLIMYGNAETKPGAIRASGNSTVTVECDYNGDGENVLDWGIMRGTGMEGDAQIYVTDNASVSSYTVAKNGGAVSGAKAADGVSVVGGNAQGDSGTLEYKDYTYVIAGTEDMANYVLFTDEQEMSDYAIYYDAEAGFCKNSADGEKLTADELPEGISAEGNTVTLDNAAIFMNASVGLVVGDGVTVYVPENSTSYIYSENHDEDENGVYTYGLEFLGTGAIRADGSLYVTAEGADMAAGIAAFGDLTINGAGLVYTEENGASNTSSALQCADNLTIRGSVQVHAEASAPDGPSEQIVGVICRRLNVKDSALLDTSVSENAMGIRILDGYDIVAEDNARINASGGIIMEGGDGTNPGAIRASGESIITVVNDHEGDGSKVLYWGIGAYGSDTNSEGNAAQIYVTDDARVYAYALAENGGAVYNVKAADGVSAAGGKTADDSDALEYKGDTYVIAGTEDTANYILFTGGERETADYAICYSAETGFRKDRFSGDPLTADELPEGMSADGNTLTLNNVDFVTTADAALVLRDGVTVNVPENTSSRIAAVSDNSEVKSVYGLEFDGTGTIQADGLLSVSAEGADMAIGIGVWGDLTITGDGEVTAEEKSVSEPSYALLCTDNLVIKDSVQVYANAYAPNGPSERVYGVICRQLNVKDGAYLDTSGGEDAMGIWIWDGYDIVAEDNARINAYGGIIMEGDAGINPGAIRASGESIIMVVSFREGDGDSVLYWGICGVTRKESGEGDPYAEDNDARIYVTGGARVLAYSIEENGGAVNKVRAVDGVSVIGGNSADESDALEYKDDTYVIAGTEDTANFIVFRSAEKEIVDYPLYFDGETGKLYKKFSHSFSTGEATFSEPVEVPGAICEKNKLTLTSDFRFCTTGEDGLALGEGTTLYVPEGESPSICSAVSGIVLSEHIGGTSGIYCCGNNTINVDGSLTVTAGDGVNIDSWGITDAGIGKDINITGKGSLTVYGGNITYDETVTEDRPRGTSCAIGAYDDINVSIAELNAVGGNAYKGSFGIVADYPGTEPHTLTVSGGSHIVAKSGRCDNAEESISCGGATNHLVIKDNSSVIMYVPGAGEKYYAAGLMVYNGDNYGNGKIELSNGGSLTLKAGNTTTSSGVAPTYLGQVDASIDGSSTFTAEGATFASLAELMGVSVVSDGKTVTFDREKYGYVDADGNLVKKISVEPAETEPSPAPTEAPAPSRGGGSGRGSSGTSAAKPTASPTPTAAPEATESPEPTEAPSETDKTEPTDAPEVGGLPFVDVTASDWFYNAVKAAYTEGLISGVTETEFAPDVTLTRGMLTAIIGRMGGAETTDGSTVFTDVDANAYYAPYVAWAAENGIVSGFGDGTFRPDENVTREQTAAIIWRYMQYIGEDVSAGDNTNILSFTDAADVSEYAIPAIQWACGDGIINGYPDGSLAPKSGITRAEFAAMISKIALI